MQNLNRLVRILSYLLLGVAAVFIVTNSIFGSKLNFSLPLVFLVLGAIFMVGAWIYIPEYRWAAYFYIPGGILVAFGLVFLLNMITGDYQAWAYAWLLLMAGAGFGAVLTGQALQWPRPFRMAAWGVTLAGLTLFALFGVIAGGAFIQLAAPIMLAGFGLILYRVRVEKFLPQANTPAAIYASEVDPVMPSADPQAALPEPLSTRELQVLRLIDQGMTNPEIAVKLVVAPSTVKTHINNIYGKLGVETRTQALNRARDLKIL
jgi:DNA-binding CsgD family transcriptional regulator